MCIRDRAASTYLRKVKIDWCGLLPLVAGSAIGSALGAQLTHFLDRKAFNPLVLGAIIAVGWYTYRRPALGLHCLLYTSHRSLRSLNPGDALLETELLDPARKSHVLLAVGKDGAQLAQFLVQMAARCLESAPAPQRKGKQGSDEGTTGCKPPLQQARQPRTDSPQGKDPQRADQ